MEDDRHDSDADDSALPGDDVTPGVDVTRAQSSVPAAPFHDEDTSSEVSVDLCGQLLCLSTFLPATSNHNSRLHVDVLAWLSLCCLSALDIHIHASVLLLQNSIL